MRNQELTFNTWYKVMMRFPIYSFGISPHFLYLNTYTYEFSFSTKSVHRIEMNWILYEEILII